jgi:hypothetical protein
MVQRGDGDRTRDSDAAHTIVFSHIPPFVDFDDEGEGWANCKPELRAPLVESSKAAGITHWFAGHYHMDALAKSEYGESSTLEVVTSAAVGAVFHSKTSLNAPTTSAWFKNIDKVVADLESSSMRVVHIGRNAIQHHVRPLYGTKHCLETVVYTAALCPFYTLFSACPCFCAFFVAAAIPSRCRTQDSRADAGGDATRRQ